MAAELIPAWRSGTVRDWPLESQIVAMGCDPPTVTDGTWHLHRERLIVHICQRRDCRVCLESRRLGLRTLRVSADDISTGRALEAIGSATYGKVNGGLF